MVKVEALLSRPKGIVFEKIADPVRDARTYLTLSNPDATRSDKVGAVMTLLNYGYSFGEVIEIIDKKNRWKGYNAQKTLSEVHKLYKYAQHKLTRGSVLPDSHLTMSVSDPSSLYHYFIEKFVIPKENIPVTNKDAAIYHWKRGRHPIPKGEGKKPLISWKRYQEVQPTLNEVMAWDWSNGVILLGTDTDCFLDIDPDGIPYINEPDFSHAFYERTPRGGYHIYGKGKLQTDKKHRGKVEVIGKGAYIVAYPTEGYKLVQLPKI